MYQHLSKEFIPYELAVELTKLGFNEKSFDVYSDGRPKTVLKKGKPRTKKILWQQAFRFFRDKYPKLDFGIGKIHNEANSYHYHINLQWAFYEGTHAEAELECLKKLIEIANE